MHKIQLILLILAAFQCLGSVLQKSQGTDCKPYGLRLNLGLKFHNSSKLQMMGVRFNTRQPCPKSYIMFQKNFHIVNKIQCDTQTFVLQTYNGYVHKCSIYNLTYGEQFSYMAFGWSGQGIDVPVPFQQKFIKTHLLSDKHQTKLVVLADWGYLRDKAQVYDPLDQAFKKMMDFNNDIDAIYIGGDIAYDLDSYQGQYYQDFIIMLSQVSSRWPLILNTGNHEHLSLKDQQILKITFQVYGSVQKRLTVINLPYVSWFMIDPYTIVFKQQDSQNLTNLFEEKLKQLNKNSPQKPIITNSHYPYRCNGNIPDCYDVRQKLNPMFLKMMQYNVALYIGAHYHTYERVHPYYYNQTFVKTIPPYIWTQGGQKNYLDNTLLSIVEGIAGNDRQIIAQYPPDQQFTAAHVINNTGFGIMTLSASSLSYEHVLHDDPFIPKDSWKILFNKKDMQTKVAANLREQ